MSELTEFLMARLGEDEAAARGTTNPITGRGYDLTLTGPFDPARVLAEVAAKRRIVTAHTLIEDPNSPEWWAMSDQAVGAYFEWTETLTVIASVYADHPDFRPEWKA